MLPESQDWKVILPKETKGKSQKVAICTTRMSINFTKLCAHMHVTAKCYFGPTSEVCLETTEAKTLSAGAGNRFPESRLSVHELVQRRVKPPLKKNTMGACLKRERTERVLDGGETPLFELKNLVHPHEKCLQPLSCSQQTSSRSSYVQAACRSQCLMRTPSCRGENGNLPGKEEICHRAENVATWDIFSGLEKEGHEDRHTRLMLGREARKVIPLMRVLKYLERPFLPEAAPFPPPKG